MDNPFSAPGAALVGRDRELAALTARLDQAVAGQGGVALLAGEPGIGKTRLAEELAATARVRGARVLMGSLLRGRGRAGLLAVGRDPARRRPRRADGGRGGHLVDLAPEARALLAPTSNGAATPSGSPEAVGPALDPAEGRFRLFDAVTAYFGARAARRPHVLILDDLHWADASSLLLLRFLARGVHTIPLLVLGAYRDVEVDRDHPLAAALAALGRERGYQHLSLRGLSPDATAALLRDVGQEEPPNDSFTQELHRLTGGNPFFVQETARHLAETGRLGAPPAPGIGVGRAPALATLAVPESVRGVIRQRLVRLSVHAARALAVAAVVGREFEVATLAAVPEAAGVPVLEALDEAEAARLVTAEPGAGAALRYRFAHDLIRETLYADLDRAARVRLHREVGEALEERFRMTLASHVSELAYHFVQAAPGGEPAKAVGYARQAGDRALAQFAYDEAARWYEQALEVQGQAVPVDAAAQCDLLLAQGDAILLAGDPRRVVDEVAPAALATAEALGAAGRERAARACRLALAGLIRYGGPGTLVGSLPYRIWTQRVERYARPDSADRVHADIALADAHSARGALAETLTLYRRALALARELDDPDTAFFAAFQLINWAGGPRHQAERARLAREFSTRPRDGVGARNVGRALWRCGAVLLDWGERAGAEALWREVAELAARAHEPDLILYEPIQEAILAILDGELAAALRAVARLIDWSAELGSPGSGRKYAARLQERPLLWLGRGVAVPDGLPLGLDATAGDVWAAGNAASVALRLAHDGETTEAHRALGEALGHLRMDGEEDASFPWHLVTLLELAVLVEDRAATELLAERLAVLAPCATADWGLTTPARHLGAAAALLGDRAKAREYSEQALAVATAVRFRPEVALASLQLAELLAGEPGEDGPAGRHLELAMTELREMTMQPALDRARRLAQRLSIAQTEATPPRDSIDHRDRLTGREVEVLRLVAAGRSNREIADQLVVSVRTVEHHIERIYRKIDARGRVDATAYALRHGLVAPDDPAP